MQDDKGLTLLEVLVAMVVLSLGLLALTQIQLTAIQVNAASGRLTQGTAIAQGKIEELMALPYDKVTTDTETRPAQGYTITWTVDEDPAVRVKTINLKVTWSNRGQKKTFDLAFFKEGV